MRFSLATICSILLLASSILTAEVIVAQTTLLSPTEVAEQMQTLPGWTTDGKNLSQTYQFESFVEAIAFVNRIAGLAEKASHYPAIIIAYNQVIISLTTHDVRGLTQQDFELARMISHLSETPINSVENKRANQNKIQQK